MRVPTPWLLSLALCVAPLSLAADTLETIYFLGHLSPANEVPPVTAAETDAKAIITMHIRRDDMGEITSAVTDFSIDYNVPVAATATGLHIHEGASGVNGPVKINSGLSASDTVDLDGSANLFRQIEVTSADGLMTIDGLLADPSAYYVNLHTTTNAGGFFRGQLTRMERVVFRTDLTPMNEVPPVEGLDATGAASVEVLYTRDMGGIADGATLRYDVNYEFPGEVTFTGLHIHPGAAGATGPAQLRGPLTGTETLVDDDGMGSFSYTIDVESQDDIDVLNAILEDPSSAYLNIHTTDNPGGAIRGQLEGTTRISYHFPFSPDNQVPPVDLDASGFAEVSIFAARDMSGEITSGTVVFDATYMFPGPVTFQGFHIHEGPMGANGPVVIDSGISAMDTVEDEDGVGALHYRINIGADDMDGLEALMGILDSPEDFYLNLHSSDNPSGVLRAQLSGMAPEPAVFDEGIVSATFGEDVNAASPGSLISIFGTDLAQATGGAIEANGKLRTNIAGTEVRIGGILAPLLYVSPTQINAQVPFEVNPGETTVVVTTSGGLNVSQALTISNSSPAIFAVVKNSDFSLATEENPVAAGEAVAVYVTGLGAGLPAVMTGQLPLADPLSFTSVSPISTVGGVAAEVAASVFAPSFVGVYQVNIIVPEGTPSGPQELQFSIDGVQSNSVTIWVQ